MNQLTFLIAGGALLLILGAAVGYMVAVVRQKRTQARAESIKAEFDAYREQVTGHFRKTAGQFQQLGVQYKALYDHLADGAQTLCKTPSGADELGFSPLPELDRPADETTAAARSGADRAFRSADGEDGAPRDYAEGTRNSDERQAESDEGNPVRKAKPKADPKSQPWRPNRSAHRSESKPARRTRGPSIRSAPAAGRGSMAATEPPGRPPDAQ